MMDKVAVGTEVYIHGGSFANCRGIEGEGNSFYYVDERSLIRTISSSVAEAQWTVNPCFNFDKFRNSARVCIRTGTHFESTGSSFSIMKTFNDPDYGIREIACLQEISKQLIMHRHIMLMEHGFKILCDPTPSLHLTSKLNYLNIVDALSHHSNKWNFNKALTCMDQIADAINAIHNLKIAHLDIRCENFVFENDGLSCIKLIDFEFARKIPKGHELIDVKEYNNFICRGYPPCIPPEVDRSYAFVDWNKVTYDYVFKKDVWGAGIVYFYLLTRHYPFGHERTIYVNQGSFHHYASAGNAPSYLAGLLQNHLIPSVHIPNQVILGKVINLFLHMLNVFPAERISIQEVRNFLKTHFLASLFA